MNSSICIRIISLNFFMGTTTDSNLFGKDLRTFSITLLSESSSPYYLSWFMTWVMKLSTNSLSFIFILSKSLLKLWTLIIFTLDTPWLLDSRVSQACFEETTLETRYQVVSRVKAVKVQNLRIWRWRTMSQLIVSWIKSWMLWIN